MITAAFFIGVGDFTVDKVESVDWKTGKKRRRRHCTGASKTLAPASVPCGKCRGNASDNIYYAGIKGSFFKGGI